MAWEWKDDIALWGAGLSTILAIMKFRESRPIVFWRPSDQDRVMSLTLVIQNPSKKPLQIFARQMLYTKSERLAFWVKRTDGGDGAGTEHAENLFAGKFHLYIPPQGEREIVLSKIQNENQGGWLVLWWHRYSLMPQMPIVRAIRGRFVQHTFGSIPEK